MMSQNESIFYQNMENYQKNIIPVTLSVNLNSVKLHIPAKFYDFSVMLTNLKDSHDLTIVF